MKRWNQTLLQNVSACVKDYSEDWEDFVKPICLVYNTSTHATTGFSPSFLMFGRQAKLPVEIMYGTPEPTSTMTTEYTQKLKSSLTEAYQKVQSNTARQLNHQRSSTTKRCMGSNINWVNRCGCYFPRFPKVNPRSCIDHGRAPLSSSSAYPT